MDFLLITSVCLDGGEIKMMELIHPKIEAELAFVTKKST